MKYIVLLALLGAVVMHNTVAAGQANFYQQFYVQCMVAQMEHPLNVGTPATVLENYCDCITTRVTARVPPEALGTVPNDAELRQHKRDLDADTIECHLAVRPKP